MRVSYFLSSLLHLFVLILVVALGGAFMAFEYAPGLRQMCYHILQEDSSLMFQIGVAIEGLALLLLLFFWIEYRRRFFTIEMRGCQAKIDEALIEAYVQEYWKESLKENAKVKVVLHSNQRVEVIANRVPFTMDDEKTLSRVQNELGVLLARRLGYEREFLLTVRA